METEHPGALARVRAAVQTLLAEGRLHPAVPAVHPMEDAARALAPLEQRTAVGKVVVVVKPSP